MSAEIAGIFISPVPLEVEKPKGGYPMEPIGSAELVEGKGLRSIEGVPDRYFAARGEATRGAYPNNKVRQLSLITQDAIERANEDREIPFTWAETRRNIVISDMSAEELNNLLDKLIALGGVEVKGTELCDPCDRPDHLSDKKGFKMAFKNKEGKSIGGLRVKILASGVISVGNSVIS